jgi:amino acid transporter
VPCSPCRPSLALNLGTWSWMAVGVVGLLAMAVALNFAEAGSRFDGTGGPYLYTRAAFGDSSASKSAGWSGSSASRAGRRS